METTLLIKKKKEWYFFIIDLLITTLEIDNWKMPYFRTRYNNGAFFEDMDPIISLINFEETHIIKIIQKTDSNYEYVNFLDEFNNKQMLVIITANLAKDRELITQRIISFFKKIN